MHLARGRSLRFYLLCPFDYIHTYHSFIIIIGLLYHTIQFLQLSYVVGALAHQQQGEDNVATTTD